MRAWAGIVAVRASGALFAATAGMKRTGHAVGTIRRWPTAKPPVPPILAMQLNTFQVYFGDDDRVEEIEVMGPTTDWQHMGAGAEFSARYDGVDVLVTSARRAADRRPARAAS